MPGRKSAKRPVRDSISATPKRAAASSAPGKPKQSAPAEGKPRIRVRRVYDPPSEEDGVRILVDRLWPRGLKKEALHIDAWPKHLTPSNALRKWYHADSSRYEEFRERYKQEIAAQGEGLSELRALLRGRTVTLLTAAKDPDISHAEVLRDLLLSER